METETAEIQKHLFKLQDLKYREFHKKLIPNIDPDLVIGVRTPALKLYAKELVKDKMPEDFLNSLPHKYYDENQLHAFIISMEKDFKTSVNYIERFLPYINNWATCDQLLPVSFKKNHDRILPYVKKWISSKKTYTVRFAIGVLMHHFLKEDFRPEYLEMVASVKSDEYYINMMRAWYFATALTFQYEETISYLEEKRLDEWTHNKTVQKACESFRVSNEQKQYLRSLKLG